MFGPTVDLQDAAAVVDLFEAAAAALLDVPGRRGCAVHLPARGRLLATGDLHDNPVHFRKVVDLARLDAGPDHHVTLHELIHGERLINGMDFSYRMLGRVAELVLARPGQVHPLLANHEIAQLTGAAVSKGAGNSTELFNEAVEFVFGDEAGTVTAALHAFITAMPLALLTGDGDGRGVLCGHSLPNERMMQRFDLDVFDRPLVPEDFRSPTGAAYLMTWGRVHDDATVEALARRWGVSLIVLGHRHVETGAERRGTRMIILNSDHQRGAVLPIDLGAVPEADEAMLGVIPLGSVQERNAVH